MVVRLSSQPGILRLARPCSGRFEPVAPSELWRSGAVLLERGDGFAVAEVGFADGTAVVRPTGDLDASVAAALSQQLAGLAGKKPDRLIFDMAAVGFVDCAAAAVMFAAARSMLPGSKPVIRAPGPLVRTVLELTGLDTQCELAD